MPNIDIEHKRRLSELLGEGHRRYGKVAPRRPYREDDDSGGGSELLFEGHPLLMNQPVGAASDLTYIVTENCDSVDKAVERQNEATNELQNKLAHVQQYSPKFGPKPTPYQ